MQNIFDFFKSAYSEFLKCIDTAKDSVFLRTIIQNITNRSNINVVLESLILCLIYTINVILNFDDIAFHLILLENIVLVISYFSAYYFIPKRNFEFKIFVLYLLALVIMSPIIIVVHSAQEIAKTYEFMLLSSCVVSLIFRSDVDNFQKLPVIMVLDRDVLLDNFSNVYNIVAVISQDAKLKEKYRVFNSLEAAKKWINFTKFIPIFSFPLRLIYVNNADISRAAQVFYFANEFGLSVVDLDLNPVNLTNFTSLLPSLITSKEFDVFKRKKVLIEDNGNPVIKILINALLSEYCDVVISSTLPYYAARMAPMEAILEDEHFDYVFAISQTNPQFFTENNLNYALTYNALRYINIVNLCNEQKVKGIFLITNNDAITANTWSGASQRLAELYVQNTGICTAVRLPKTLLDLENCISDVMYCDAVEIYNIFIKFIVHVIRKNRHSNRIYSIIPENHIDIEKAFKLVYEMKKCEKHVYDKILPSLDEPLQPTEIPNVYSTEFQDGHQYDISELEEIRHSQSRLETTERLLKLLHAKTNPL